MVEVAGVPRVVRRDEALRRGYTWRMIDRRLASGAWQRLLPRTYLTAAPASELDRYRAALLFAGDDSLLSGASGLRVGGFDRIPRPAEVLVLVPPNNRIESIDWVRVRASARAVQPALWPGPRHVDVPRAAADYAVTLTRLDDVRALLALVIRSNRCSLEELDAELRCGPRKGSKLLREALADVRDGAASAPEARAARALRRSKEIPPFEQNVEIRLPDGRAFVADFYWRALRAILEIDSVEFHFDPADWRATMDRHLALTTLGLAVVHRPPSALRDEARFVADIAAWLANRSREVGRIA